MNIVIIGTAYPFRGGLAAFNERLAREFQKKGHQVSVETFTLQYPSLLFPGKSQMATWEKPDDLKICRSVNSVNPFNWLKVGRKIKKSSPDIVIIKYWIPFMAPCFGTIARIVRKNRKTRIICIADNIIPHERRPGDMLLTGFFMKSIDGMVTMSQSVAGDALHFRKNLPLRLSPHPLFDDFGQITGRDPALKALGLATEYRYVLFFGFIRDYKGLDWLLEAFADERLRRFPLKLIVAGEFYSPPRPYLDMIEKMNLQQHVILRNEFIANQEVNNYFCASDLVVQPYKHATQSGVTQIAYYFNRPMVVTRVGGLAEMVPDQVAGYVVDPEPKAIAAAMVDFFRNNRMEAFSKNVEKEKLKFEWGNMVDAITRVHHETLQQ